jgi:disulfide bond formation protein DsbB
MNLPTRAWLDVAARHLPTLVMAACVFSLGFAYTSQYVFGLQPCVLCLYQRPPYFIAIFLALLAWLLSRRGVTSPWSSAGPILLTLAAVFIAIGGAIGAYQVGVEEHWWSGPAGCSGGSLAGLSATEILARIEDAATIRCDEVQFRFLGLSMAAMNAFWSIGLAIGIIVLLHWGRYRTHPTHIHKRLNK